MATVKDVPVYAGSNEWVLVQLDTIRRAILPSTFRSSAYTINSIHGRIALGAFWSLLGTGVGQGLAFLTTICSARLLGAHHYGELSIITSTINLFSMLAFVGLGMTATKHVAEFRQADPRRAGRIIGLSSVIATGSGLFLGGLLALLAPYLSEHVLKSPHLTLSLRLGGVTLCFAALNGAQTGALAGFEAFRELAIANALKGVLTAVFVCALTLHVRVTGAVIGYGLASCISCFISHRLVRDQCRRHKIRITYSSLSSELPVLWTFSIPVLVSSIPFTPVTWFCNTLLATTAGYSEAGIYTAASQFQQVMLFFASSLSGVALPLLSHTVPEKNLSKYKQLLTLNTILTVGSVVTMAGPLALFAPVVMKLYGAGFQQGGTVLRVICLSTAIGTLNSAVPHAIWSLSAAGAGMLLSLLRCTVLVSATYLLVHNGAVGFAMSYLIVAVVQTSTEIIFLRRLLHRCRLRWEAPRSVI